MIATTEDFFKEYPELLDNSDVITKVEGSLKLASEIINKITGTKWDEAGPLPYSHPLNAACRRIAWYESQADKKELLATSSERIEGYSIQRKTGSLYGAPEVDNILKLYISPIRGATV